MTGAKPSSIAQTVNDDTRSTSCILWACSQTGYFLLSLDIGIPPFFLVGYSYAQDFKVAGEALLDFEASRSSGVNHPVRANARGHAADIVDSIIHIAGRSSASAAVVNRR
jgi:hypothetical protein